jgi:hypothetical protein
VNLLCNCPVDLQGFTNRDEKAQLTTSRRTSTGITITRDAAAAASLVCSLANVGVLQADLVLEKDWPIVVLDSRSSIAVLYFRVHIESSNPICSTALFAGVSAVCCVASDMIPVAGYPSLRLPVAHGALTFQSSCKPATKRCDHSFVVLNQSTFCPHVFQHNVCATAHVARRTTHAIRTSAQYLRLERHQVL